MFETNPNLSPEQFRDLPETVQILDVRQPAENQAACLPRSILIPLDQLSNRLAELDPARPVAVYCHHGSRSFFALRFLAKAGFTQVAHLAGGIAAYSRLDPTIPTY
jgi:rhodanese-related sulfurtransferase